MYQNGSVGNISILESFSKRDEEDGEAHWDDITTAFALVGSTSRTQVDQRLLGTVLVLPSVSTANSILSAVRLAMMQ